MRHTRHGSSAATLLCRCTDARTCATRPVRRPGRLGWIALLPGVLIGFCLGAWMLAITLEWLGEAFFWRNICASHSEQVLQATWLWWKSSAGAPMWLVEDLAIVSDTLQQGIAALVHSLNGQSGLFWTETITTVIRCALLSASKLPLPFCYGWWFCCRHCRYLR